MVHILATARITPAPGIKLYIPSHKLKLVKGILIERMVKSIKIKIAIIKIGGKRALFSLRTKAIRVSIDRNIKKIPINKYCSCRIGKSLASFSKYEGYNWCKIAPDGKFT